MPVRKDIRSLSEAEWDDVVEALWVMKRTPLEAGRRVYGAAYRSYDSLEHVVVSLNNAPACDAAHFSE